MDRFLYIAMNGARNALHAQQVNANNLANVNTTGFKAELDRLVSEPVYGPGHASRAYASDYQAGADLGQGPVMTTGRDLDVAVSGNGWFAVQDGNGDVAYSRRGDLHVDPAGVLFNGANQVMLGEGGPITLPDFASAVIGRDGTISIRASGQAANALVAVDRLLLVNPPADVMQRGEDGLFRARDGGALEPDASVKLINGALEGSNVNSVESMIQMMEQARFYETQVKLMTQANENDAASSRLMRLSG